MTGADALTRLAAVHGVASSYQDAHHRRIEVDRDALVAILAQVGVDATRRETVADALAVADRGRRRGLLPATVVATAGIGLVLGVDADVHTEGGETVSAGGQLPLDLPIGYHRIVTTEQDVALLVAPRRLTEPPAAWGLMVQAYALRSATSWGIGDFGDVRELARWAGCELGAGALLLNPLHAIIPTTPVQRSPYSPSSRRFTNPLYLSIPALPELRSAGARTRERVLALAGPAVAASAELIDYDEVWRAKRAALELLVPDRSALRQLTGEDAGRGEFALFCALAEEHGPDWRRWPAALRDPASAAVGEAARRLADRVGLHAWIQLRCGEQLADVQAAAASSGLRAGVIHDLPVGVDPAGADAWAMQDALAGGVTVGAPPDVFNQRGQDWGLPPWRPDRLAATGYAPLRDVVHRCLAHADGLRVDHVAGLWRLWWVPSGSTPDRGSYVRYDADAMLAVLAIEAERVGATVIGEDLGTVEPVVTETLHDKGMASSAVLWFQRPGDEVAGPLQPAAAWPAPAMASISTHDLPTAAGFLRAEHVRVRAALGQLARSEADELAAAAADRRDVLDLLAAEGLLPAGSGGADAAEPSEEDLIVAMHVLLARTPCRLAMVALTDVLGDARQPNLPGTVDEYPNWQIPLGESLEQIEAEPRVRRAVAALRAARPRSSPGATSG